VFAGFEGGDGVGFVVFVRGEDEDHVDGGVVEDAGGVGGPERDVEFGGTVFCVLGGEKIGI
jgi:hypothetical protein